MLRLYDKVRTKRGTAGIIIKVYPGKPAFEEDQLYDVQFMNGDREQVAEGKLLKGWRP